MKNTSRLIHAGVALALAAGLAANANAQNNSTNIFGFSGGSGQPAAGYGFETGNGTFTLTASGSNYNFTYNGSIGGANAAYLFYNGTYSGEQVSNATMTMSGTLAKSGGKWTITGGTESIGGTIAACSTCGPVAWNSGTSPLYAANLSNLTATTAGTAGAVIGFNANFTGTSSWMLSNNVNGGSYNESVYLYALSNTSTSYTTSISSNSAFNAFVQALATGGSLASGAINAHIGAFSTVPLPLSGLLLGGGLLGLGGFARRRVSA